MKNEMKVFIGSDVSLENIEMLKAFKEVIDKREDDFINQAAHEDELEINKNRRNCDKINFQVAIKKIYFDNSNDEELLRDKKVEDSTFSWSKLSEACHKYPTILLVERTTNNPRGYVIYKETDYTNIKEEDFRYKFCASEEYKTKFQLTRFIELDFDSPQAILNRIERMFFCEIESSKIIDVVLPLLKSNGYEALDVLECKEPNYIDAIYFVENYEDLDIVGRYIISLELSYMKKFNCISSFISPLIEIYKKRVIVQEKIRQGIKIKKY